MQVCGVYVSVCVSVQMTTFEPLKLETSFLAHTYILVMSRTSLSSMVIGLKLYKVKRIKFHNSHMLAVHLHFTEAYLMVKVIGKSISYIVKVISTLNEENVNIF